MSGKAVQLQQGERKLLEVEDPLEMVRRFEGFPEIQVIDLDAAKGVGSNFEVIAKITAQAPCRIGGGVRSLESARRLFDAGALSVIVGTAAFTPLLQELSYEFGADRLMVALDSRANKVVVEGWQKSTAVTTQEVIPQLENLVGGFLCTYVDKEGLMQGTDLDWFRRLRKVTGRKLTAAGGISTYDEICELTSLNIDCAIGMAMYTGLLDIKTLKTMF